MSVEKCKKKSLKKSNIGVIARKLFQNSRCTNCDLLFSFKVKQGKHIEGDTQHHEGMMKEN